MKKHTLSFFMIFLGAIAQGIGVSIFLDPYGIAPGGVMGIAIMLSRFIPIKTGTIILLINIPLLVASYFSFGREFFVKTLVATVLTSVSIDLFSGVGAVSDDILLCAVAGGALVALSIGIIFKAGGTTGGMDIIVRYLRRSFPHLKSGTIFLIVDGIICAISGLVFRDISFAFYSFVSLGVSSKLLDFVLYGSDEAKLVFIFSEKNGEIMKKLLISIEVGATNIHGEGGFTKNSQNIIMCAIKKSRYPKLEKAVKEIDPKSFMVVTSASEIYGKGFKNYSDLLI